ncbi:MAG: type II secretion system protein GspM [Thermodesulfobacteriota bacterium]
MNLRSINLRTLQNMDRRTLLVALAVAALVFGTLRFLVSYYQGQVEQRDKSRNELSFQRKQVADLPGLELRLRALQRQADQLQRMLFTAGSLDGVSSAVQIRLQAMITDAGLEPESLRPVTDSRQTGKSIQTITIKMRLAGSLEQFEKFLAHIYRSKQLFLVDSLTVKPYRKEGVKVFIDVKALYRLSGASEDRDGEGGNG